MSSIAGVHKPTSITDVWLTPPHVLAAFPAFDLDPCAAPEPRPWPTATRMSSLPVNGLTIPWDGCVWMNPPYGRETDRWLGRLADHGNGVALIFARTETAMFFEHVWPKASALLFLEGRLTFCDRHGKAAAHNSGGPSVLVAYGVHAQYLLWQAAKVLPGKFINLHQGDWIR